MIPDKDPLSLTPLVDLEKQNKRPLEITPPATENKIIRNEEQVKTTKQLVFTHSEPNTARMDENAPATMKSITEYFDSKFDRFETDLKSVKTDIAKLNNAIGDLNDLKDRIDIGDSDRIRISSQVVELKNEIVLIQSKPLPPNIDKMKADLKNEVKNELKEEMKADLKKELLDEISTDIKNDISTELSSLYEGPWLNMVEDEIRRHEAGLVISGHDFQQINTQQVRYFLRDNLALGARADTLVIRSVTVLSRGKSTNPRLSILVMFGSIAERNECIRQSFNLARGITLDKYVPKRYEAQYRAFKEQAWKLRESMNVNTWIGFEGHALVLKQKEKDLEGKKYAWNIFDSWSPKVTDPQPVSKKSAGKAVSAESKVIDKNATSKMLFISGHRGVDNVTEFESKLKSDLLGQEDLKLIEKVSSARKGTFVLHFHDQKLIAAFKNKYSGHDFLGGKIRFT